MARNFKVKVNFISGGSIPHRYPNNSSKFPGTMNDNFRKFLFPPVVTQNVTDNEIHGNFAYNHETRFGTNKFC